MRKIIASVSVLIFAVLSWHYLAVFDSEPASPSRVVAAELANNQQVDEADTKRGRQAASMLNDEPHVIVPADYAQETELTEEQIIRVTQLVNSVLSSADERDWQKFKQLIAEMELDNPQALQFGLNIALAKRASIDVVKHFIESGAVFTDANLPSTLAANDMALLQYAVNNGLDLHATVLGGRNAISFTMAGPTISREVFDYLLDSNLDVNPKVDGPSPLNYAIQNLYLSGSHSDYYLERLLNAGAKVSAKDIKELELYRDAMPEVYNKWIDRLTASLQDK